MKILIVGASGFIGRHLCARLAQDGHEIVSAGCRARGPDAVTLDYSRPVRVSELIHVVRPFDVVINSVGILVESPGRRFAAIHESGPIALFEACTLAGVGRVIQISALGAETCSTPYFATKYETELHLASLDVDWHILRPSVVYGPDGSAARMFRALARLPIVPLPGGGGQAMQPVHVDDIAEGVARLTLGHGRIGQTVAAVGASVTTYRDMLRSFRRGLGFAPAREFAVPRAWIEAANATVGRLPGVLLNADTWKMLEQGSTADAGPFGELLGRPPLGVEQFLSVSP